MKITKTSHINRRLHGPLTALHAHPGGGSVLLGESSWRTINGFLVCTRWGSWCIEFRRYSS